MCCVSCVDTKYFEKEKEKLSEWRTLLSVVESDLRNFSLERRFAAQ